MLVMMTTLLAAVSLADCHVGHDSLLGTLAHCLSYMIVAVGLTASTWLASAVSSSVVRSGGPLTPRPSTLVVITILLAFAGQPKPALPRLHDS